MEALAEWMEGLNGKHILANQIPRGLGEQYTQCDCEGDCDGDCVD